MKALGNKKIIIIIIILFAALILSYIIPTLARYKTRNLFEKGAVWSGNIATKFRSGNGSQNNPYIISNGEELAFLSQELSDNDFANTYFKLSNNIILNEGEFIYDNSIISYLLNGNTYYVNNNDYYTSNTFEGEKSGSLNIFNSLDGFKGIFDGNNKIIYGYYGNNSLFDHFSGNISNLYIENAFINTTNNASIFANNVSNASISNILIDGTIISPINNTILSNSDLFSNLNSTNAYIAALSNNVDSSTITNVVNHANIYGSYLGSGLINILNDSSVSNTYNTGSINATVNTTYGIVSGTSTINNSYTTGLNDSLIGIVNNAALTINNSFMVNNHPFIIDDINGSYTTSNNYYIYADNSINGSQVSLSNLIDATYLTNYPEYSSSNQNNPWIFDGYNLPVLYFDDLVTKCAILQITSNSWNSYSPVLNTVLFNNNIVFAIDDVDNLNQTTKYYYISNSTNVIDYGDLSSLNWTLYQDLVTINTEGSYIVYVKIVDSNLNERYINSDILVLDQTNPVVGISYNGNNYNTISNSVDKIANNFSVSVTATDSMSDIKAIKYYIANAITNDLSNVAWLDYEDTLSFTNLGNYIVYIKATDNAGNISYASTPLIKYNGYVVTDLKPLGFNSGSSVNDKSSVTFNIEYNNGTSESFNHYLVSNIALPTNTLITIQNKNKVYEYSVANATSCLTNYYCYPLTSFKEVGRNDNTYYVNGSETDELFKVIVDFKNITINSNITNLKINMVGIDNGNNVRLPIDSIGINISTSSNDYLAHVIATTYNDSIIINSNSTYQIPVSSVIDFKNNQDTTYADKKIGLALSFVDGNDNIKSEFLSNIIVSVDNVEYYPDSDHIIRISLNRNTSVNKTITIQTSDGNNLEQASGYLKISGYASYDGLYNPLNTTNNLMIPYVINDNTYYSNYSYDVTLSNDSQIINKNDTVSLVFGINVSGIDNPIIKVSMYQKDQLTAYNQSYSIIDMQNYTDTTLNRERANYYYVNRSININNDFTYRLNTTNLNRSSYRFAFELYDGNKKVTTIYKYIIVK